MSLSDDALITVADARIYCELISSDKPADEWFEIVINGLSARIQDRVGHKYRPRSSSAEPRIFPYTDGHLLTVDDCTDIETVEFTPTPNDADSWETVDSEHWFAEPLDSDEKDCVRFVDALELPAVTSGWSALSMHLRGRTRTPWPAEQAVETQKFLAVRVTAKWGFENVPDHVQLACMLWIKQLLNRDVLLLSDELAVATIFNGKIPADVEGILAGLDTTGSGIGVV